MRPRATLLGCLILLLGLAGCDGKDLATDSFVGTWAVTSGSKALLPAESQRRPGELAFAGDGRFSSEAIPGELLYSMPGMHSAEPVSGTGTWRVHKLDGNTALLLTFHNITTPNGYQVPNSTELLVDNLTRETTLYFFLGDPDQGKRVEFRKIN